MEGKDNGEVRASRDLRQLKEVFSGAGVLVLMKGRS